MNQSLETAVRPDTKEKILDVAERLFAEHGFPATTLRDITAEAGVNLAAVNYHFRSKEALLSAVLQRRLGPVNARRLELLEQAHQNSHGGKLALEDVIRAFIQPVYEARGAGIELGNFARLMARVATDQGDWAISAMREQMQGTVTRFLPLLSEAMDAGDPMTVAMAMQLTLGAMAHSMKRSPSLTNMVGADASLLPPAEHLEQLICYTVAGMRALAERERSR
jgi:AcrR family transcriptional regulator